uniref:EF-hand domain-containing protein n=1 Tax=Physcomitrium patens TaxID=3218 RepID=A0A7I4DZV8_PHYPA
MGLIQSQERRGQLTKIERRMVQAMAERAQKVNVTLKTFNTFILKFPKIDASFEAVREVFNKADKNGDGSLDMEELKQCLQELQVEYSDQEIEEFHHESDMDASHGIQFKEFIVVLALIYLLGRPTHTGVVSFLVIILLFYLRLFSFLFFLNTAEIYMFTS